MSVPSCSTCRHSRAGKHPHESYLRCVQPDLLEHSKGDPWFASVIRGFEEDEQGRPWCGAMGRWHEPRQTEEQPA